jgi:hypothetical protein
MWTFSTEFVSLLLLGAVAAIAVLVWRVRVWLNRWAKAMIACYPEMLHVRETAQIGERRMAKSSQNADAEKSAAALDRKTAHGVIGHHFDHPDSRESSLVSPTAKARGRE